VTPLQNPSAAEEITQSASEDIRELLVADDGTIFFTSQRDQGRKLYAVGADGSERRTVTSGGVLVLGPVLVPDQGGVVFGGLSADALVSHVYHVDLEGGPMTQLTQGGGELPVAVSPNGKWILFRRLQEISKIWRAAMVGGEPEVQIEEAPGFIGYSPNGDLLAYLFNREVDERLRLHVRIVPSAGGEPQLEFLPPGGAQQFRWLRDGSGITYVHTVDGISNIWKQATNGVAPTQLTHFREGRISRYEWSEDGSRMVMERQFGERESLWSVGASGGAATQLMDAHGRTIFDFAVSKDQKFVVVVLGDMASDVVLIRDASADKEL
jgi:Tol biopolymer transport system component